jgi:rod shape-determining protein MreD
VVQVTVLSRLPLPGATPDVVLLALVAFALRYGELTGAITGFCTGLALDLVPPADGTVGRWAFVLCLVGYLCGVAREAAERSALMPLLVVALAAAGSVVLYAALGVPLGDERISWPAVGTIVPSAVLYDVVLTPLVVLPVVGLSRRVEPDLLHR